MTSSPAATFAARLVSAFVAAGVRHAVVSPGSRSQALALALAEAETRGSITLHVRIDERVAGFTALGLARETGRPALVVTTSGTAVANLMPAVVEASHSGVPMIVLSADRPSRLRGTGSNQTTWQPGLFGRFVRAERDVSAPHAQAIPDARELAEWTWATATAGLESGPVHLNLQFVEPLSGAVEPEETSGQPVRSGDAGAGADADAEAEGEGGGEGGGGAVAVADAVTEAGADADAPDALPAAGPDAATLAPSGGLADSGVSASGTLHLAPGPRTLVVAGADAGERANAFALAAGWPLVAEISSGARFGPMLVNAYRILLDHPDFGGRVERAVVFGHPTLSRQVAALIARDDVETIVVRGAGEPVRPHPDARVVDEVTADPEDRGDRAARAWSGQWVFAGRELLNEETAADEVAAPLVTDGGSDDLAAARDYARGELAALRAPVSRRALALAVWRATWPHDRLVLGASRLIRELDAAAPGKKVIVHSNRGLAGIDGTVSTATGIALGAHEQARPGTTRVLLGDLTLLHDVGGLLQTPGESWPRLQLVVGNDGGGTIFDGLEVASTADPDAFDRVLFTPQRVDLAALATAYGWGYRRVEHRGELDSVLASPAAEPSIVEVVLAR